MQFFIILYKSKKKMGYLCQKFDINLFIMKKIYLLIALFCASILSLTAQMTVNMDEIDDDVAAKGRPTLNRYRDDFSMWSVSAKVGLSFFDGDVAQKYNNVFPKSGGDLALGISAERSFNPLWGIGVEYMFIPMRAEDDALDFTGDTHNASVYMSLNVANLLYRYRRCKFNVYFNVGIGMTFYNSESTKNSGIYIQASGTRTQIPTPNEVKHGRAMQIPMGVNAEWNFHRNWALSWNTQIRLYNKDNFEADKPMQGTSDDVLLSTTLGIRYKFGASKKPHMRNICMGYAEKRFQQETNNEDPTCCETLAKENAEQQIQLDSLKAVLSEYAPCINKIIENGCDEPKKDTIVVKEEPAKPVIDETLDSDGDGVPDIRDLEPNTPKGSFVDYYGRAISNALEGSDKIKSVYFNVGSYNTSDQTANAGNIEEIAKKMQADPDAKLEIRGYCDPRGSVEFNQKLSDNRVNAVKKVLVSKYGIDASRITGNGYGKSINENLSNDLRRRCDFFLSTDDFGTTQSSATTQIGKVTYRVQLCAKKIHVSTTNEIFNGLKDVDYYEEDGLYKYTYGDTTSYSEAVKLRNQAKAIFPEAFIVTFVDGKKNNENK